MLKKWLQIFLPALLAAVLALGMSRELQTRLFPRLTLRRALASAITELQVRFEGNPVLHIASCMARPQQQICLQSKSGAAVSDAVIQLSPRIITGNIQGQSLSASFYADSDILAVASPQFTGDQWFGIKYDSFSEDISQIPLIRWILPDQVLATWEAALESLRDKSLTKIPTVPLPEVTEQELARLPLIVAALKPTVSRTVLQRQSGPEECMRILCEADGKSLGLLSDGDFFATCAFYLLDSRLILAQIQLQSSGQQLQLHLETEGAFAADPIILRCTKREGESERSFTARVAESKSEDMLSEAWDVFSGGQKWHFSYQWNPDEGDGVLHFGEESAPFLMKTSEQGFSLALSEGASVIRSILPNLPAKSLPEEWVFQVRPGTEPERPEFHKPDTWTTEDLLTLMEGLGESILPFP